MSGKLTINEKGEEVSTEEVRPVVNMTREPEI